MNSTNEQKMGFKAREFNVANIHISDQEGIEKIGDMSIATKRLYIRYLRILYEKGELIRKVINHNPYNMGSDYRRDLMINVFRIMSSKEEWSDAKDFDKKAKRLQNRLLKQTIKDFPKNKRYILVFKPDYTVWHNGKKLNIQRKIKEIKNKALGLAP